MKTGRNAPCPCGSGKKYKNCCLNTKASFSIYQKLLATLFALIILGGLVSAIAAFRSHEPASGPKRVWSAEHQHWH